MTVEDFVQRVIYMRDCQKKFEKKKNDIRALYEKASAEKAVDAMLAERKNRTETPPSGILEF